MNPTRRRRRPRHRRASASRRTRAVERPPTSTTRSESTKDGAKVAGATGPVEDDEMKAADPADTDRGATASPADEQPAARCRRPRRATRVGPAHVPGTRAART